VRRQPLGDALSVEMLTNFSALRGASHAASSTARVPQTLLRTASPGWLSLA
jgi:hypothetical protein